MLTEAVSAEDKDAARFVHWGATSQDVIDTGLVLQLRDVFTLVKRDLGRLSETLVELAKQHRATPVVGRTWMQQALPTTFGLIAAGWLDSILRQRIRLSEIRTRILSLQFGGAVGTLAALGQELQLELPEIPWHTQRDRIAEVAAFFGLLAGSLGKIARDISLHAQTEIGELSEPDGEGRGGSSTMPHKRNPVTCAVVLAAATRVPGLVSAMFSAMPQEQQRSVGVWHAEWETLPEIVRLSAGALRHLAEMMPHLEVHTERMRQNLDSLGGLVDSQRDECGKRPANERRRRAAI